MALADDRDLIRRFKAGDPSGFEGLVRRYRDRVYNLCRYILNDTHDAQDAAQDAFIKAYRGLKTYSSEAGLYTWLYRITINTCLDYNKRSRPKTLENETFLENVASRDPSPEELYQSKETGRLIQSALRKLPEKLRAAIVLKEIEALSYEEIAEALDTSVGTVKSRISRARDELRRLLKKKLEA
jgi:RNA polymerase sigma-70 factor, ECF subfamily